jgi:RNA polymerase sigma-70 factor (ECF subfamily)
VSDLDEITLARAQRGDRAAFRTLVETYQRPVHALLGRMLCGRARQAELEDLAQETFLRVYRALPELEARGPGRLGKWILTIATRLALDELRRYRPAPVASEVTEALPGAERADHGTERRALSTALTSAILELSPEQRAVFLLREVHELDYQDIAAALDIDLGTVKSRLARARAKLQGSLHEVRHG